MDIVNRFLGFDHMMGKMLVKFVYYAGLIGIALAVIGQMFGAMAMLGHNAAMAFGLFIFAPIGGLLGLLFWRFVCELYIVMFNAGEDLKAIRKATPGAN